ncbi:MAG: outer membrane protein transport protein [Alphaproteobacteria bacterium]|nr:outer membrane protein transport protein [Alphaproteobacteria bacterium]
MRHHRILALAATIIALADGAAWASGFQLREESGEGLGNAYAGSTAKAYDVDTLFHNPAGMTRLHGDQAGASAAWVMPSSRFDGTNTLRGVQVPGSDGGDHPLGVLVGAAYLMWDPADDWRLGLALTAPFGMRSDYDEDWVGRYHALDSELTTVNLSPSVAYRVNRSLSVAAGAQVEWVDILLTNAVNFGASDGLFRVTGDDWALGWTASALVEFTPSTRAGFAYRSRMRHDIRGDAAFEGVPLALAANPAFLASGTRSVITLPDTATVGVYHEITPQWAVMADVSRTGWSVFRTLRLEFDDDRPAIVQPQNWNDTWFGALGATWKPTERLTLQVGTAYDVAPVEDEFRNPRIPDSDRIWVTGGVGYTPAPGHRLSLTYGHIFGGSASIDRDDPLAGRLTGEYDNHVDLVGAQYTIRF